MSNTEMQFRKLKQTLQQAHALCRELVVMGKQGSMHRNDLCARPFQCSSQKQIANKKNI